MEELTAVVVETLKTRDDTVELVGEVGEKISMGEEVQEGETGEKEENEVKEETVVTAERGENDLEITKVRNLMEVLLQESDEEVKEIRPLLVLLIFLHYLLQLWNKVRLAILKILCNTVNTKSSISCLR